MPFKKYSPKQKRNLQEWPSTETKIISADFVKLQSKKKSVKSVTKKVKVRRKNNATQR